MTDTNMEWRGPGCIKDSVDGSGIKIILEKIKEDIDER